jgi:tetratricopeptide (TPR) repeat protein
LARAGFFTEAIKLLSARASGAASGRTTSDPRELGTEPLIHYCLGWLHLKLDDTKAALVEFKRGAAAPPDYCFPSRLEEIAILEAAMAVNPSDARAPYYLGNLLYDRRRHAEAIRLWERSARLEPTYSVVWRNLGIGYFNTRHNAGMARTVYDRAFRVNPNDSRLLFERDQLWKRLGEKPIRRLRELEKRLDLVRERDDLTVELCALYNQTGRHADALALVSRRHFQPWEGGEGGPLGQWVRSHLALGRAALGSGRAAQARELFQAALTAPQSLGEAKHLLANQSDIHYWLGRACDALGEKNSARRHWRAAATFKGDFQEMSIRAFSAMTSFSAWSWEYLGQAAKAKKLFADLLDYARKLQEMPAKIDYFATSLPTMLLFDDDLQFRQATSALFLQAQAHLGLKRRAKTKVLLAQVLKRDPNHPLAADLLAELSAQ